MPQKTKDTRVIGVALTPKQEKELRRIAKRHGFKIGRGKQSEWGSIRKLLLAIASGELIAVAPSTETEAEE